jgi:hypothetical protein
MSHFSIRKRHKLCWNKLRKLFHISYVMSPEICDSRPMLTSIIYFKIEFAPSAYRDREHTQKKSSEMQ